MHHLARAVYSALLWLVQPLLRAKLARRAKVEALYGQLVDERFGYYSAAVAHTAPGAVWVHAVSLGETRAAALLIAQLRASLPDMRLLLTHGTATGRAEGAALLQVGDVQVWQPWDTQGACERFFAQFKPRIGIVMETEVWPNLCRAAQHHGVPMVLANARLNAASQSAAQRLAWLAKPAYASFRQVWAQTADDAQRLIAVGAQQVTVQGNVKYDAAPNPAQVAAGQAWRAQHHRPVVMLASSRDGEEALFLEQIMAFSQSQHAQEATDLIASSALLQQHSQANQPPSASVQWLIVPRHPQRFDAVAQLITQAGFTLSRRSQWGDSPQAADVWLGDSLGEMALYYGLADVALLGGSFAPLGGQNLIEAIAAGCPVVMGPHTFNFAEAAQTAVAQGAALRCANMAAALRCAAELASAAPRHAAMQAAGHQWLSSSRGAAARMAQAVLSLLKA
jgi:3-deoxy-D-manno-octulosonic-acid transferase